jgi:hypothetical protein
VQTVVYKAHGVRLETEVKIIGEPCNADIHLPDSGIFIPE